MRANILIFIFSLLGCVIPNANVRAGDDIDLHALSNQQAAVQVRLSPDKQVMLDFVKRYGAGQIGDKKLTGWGGRPTWPIMEHAYIVAVLIESYGAQIPEIDIRKKGGEGLLEQNCITTSYGSIASEWTEYYGADDSAKFIKAHYHRDVSPEEMRAEAKTRISDALQGLRRGTCGKHVTQETYDAYLKLLDDVQEVERQNIKVTYLDNGHYVEERVR